VATYRSGRLANSLVRSVLAWTSVRCGPPNEAARPAVAGVAARTGPAAVGQRGATGKAGALVIGGGYRSLGVVRSLGRRGVPVWVLSDAHRLAATSRYCQRSLPWPLGGEAKQVQFLLNLARREDLDGWVLFPSEDESAALIARYHDVLAARFRLTSPNWEVIRWAYDKRLTYQLAEQVGVDYPWTYYPADRECLRTLACEFPVVLKPAIKQDFNAFTHAKAWLAPDRRALLDGYASAARLVAPELIMVQERIPGSGAAQYSYAALCQNGRVLVSLVVRRTRQYPLEFGRASSFVESVEEPAVEESAERLLQAIGYSGLVEVEFKRDERDGRYKLLDLNPRVWGWHTLGQRAGVDFSYLTWQWVNEGAIPRLRGVPGARWIRLLTDVPAAVAALWRGETSLWEYLSSLRLPLELAIYASDDPLPALADLPLLGYVAWKRGAV
jgi:D-aspartate ligase